jgi:hypothetical protein
VDVDLLVHGPAIVTKPARPTTGDRAVCSAAPAAVETVLGGDPAKVNGQTLQHAVNDNFVYRVPIPGGTGTEYFPAAETITTGCSTLVQVVGTAYKQIAPFRCSGAFNVRTGQRVSDVAGKTIS